jgi:transketolase
VLSNGHGSMLIYALLHLTGYELPISELKNFRQLHSKTAGHPEVGITPGVETTTGPLGQGITNAVGMALAEKLLAAEFNRDGHTIVDHHTYVFLGDGCLMEGISHEACALAGAWKLNKLIALYDDNGIHRRPGRSPGSSTTRRCALPPSGWNVIGPIDGHDADAVDRRHCRRQEQPTRPRSSSARRTSARAAQPRQHRQGPRRAAGRRGNQAHPRSAGLDHAPFVIPAEVYADWDAKAAGLAPRPPGTQRFAAYKAAHPELAAEFVRRMKGDLPATLPRWRWTPPSARTPRPRPWPAARPASWRWKPSPLRCPSCWAAAPT